jgi:hypothetical protein
MPVGWGVRVGRWVLGETYLVRWSQISLDEGVSCLESVTRTHASAHARARAQTHTHARTHARTHSHTHTHLKLVSCAGAVIIVGFDGERGSHAPGGEGGEGEGVSD